VDYKWLRPLEAVECFLQSFDLGGKDVHHIQIGYHRDNSGNVTHDWVNFDSTHSVFSNTTAPAMRAWAGRRARY